MNFDPGSSAGARRPQVLLVDDDDDARRSVHLLLHWRGFDVRSHAATASLIEDSGATNADWLVTEDRLTDGDGITVIRTLRQMGWRGRAVLMTTSPSDDLCRTAVAAGFETILEKPLRQYEVVSALARPAR